MELKKDENEKEQQELENQEIEEKTIKIDEEELEKKNESKEETLEKIDEPNKEETYKVVKTKDNKKNKIAIITMIITVVIIILMILSTGFALINLNNTNIIQGVKIQGIDVGGLSIEQAKEKLTKIWEEKLEKNVILKLEEFETNISKEQIEADYNIDDVLNEAYLIGRNNNIFMNNYQIILASISKINIEPTLNYNKELLEKIILDISSKIPNAIKENSYYVEGDKLIITKGKEGLVIKKEELIEKILIAMNSLTDKHVEIPVETKIPEEIDIDKIYKEVYTEAKNAYYTKEPFQIFPHVNGIDFDIEQAKEILKEEKEEYEIQLNIKVPETTTDKIGTEAFPDLLSSFTTKYDASNYNRSTNLKLASDKINGTVLMPGEEFSYNKVVGERTIAAGYKEAAIYSGGKVVDGLGGGICQISSTLYDAVVYANLEVTDRTNHRFITSYVGVGKDATVVYGQIDFKFKNSRNYPIKIVSSVKGGIAKIDIYGIKEDVEYEVEIISTVTQTIPYTTVYEQDSSMEAGKEVVIQKGASGYKSVTYKILKLNGNTVSKTLLSSDTYSAMQRIVKRGTKQVNTTPTTKPVTTKPATNTTVNTNTNTNVNSNKNNTNTANNTTVNKNNTTVTNKTN